MRFYFVSALALSLALLSGCATRAVQTETYLASPPTDRPRQVKIENVPFIDQKIGHCGPATLAMATAWAGRPIDVSELTKQVYTPGAKGSFQADMIATARRNAFVAVPIRGLPALMTELAAGHPVIVFENLMLTWYPQWHYAVAFGYDLDNEDIILHSGSVKEKHWSLRKFERSWMLGDYWGLVVLPPGVLAASADDLAHASAALGLEQAGHASEAEKTYLSILEKWPTSLAALIGEANFEYARGHVKEAVTLLSTATGAHPEAAAAWHNLAIAQGEAGQTKQAKLSASKAMALVAGETKASYSVSLKDWL